MMELKAWYLPKIARGDALHSGDIASIPAFREDVEASGVWTSIVGLLVVNCIALTFAFVRLETRT